MARCKQPCGDYACDPGCIKTGPHIQSKPAGECVARLRDALRGLRDAVDAAGYSTEFQRNLSRADAVLREVDAGGADAH